MPRFTVFAVTVGLIALLSGRELQAQQAQRSGNPVSRRLDAFRKSIGMGPQRGTPEPSVAPEYVGGGSPNSFGSAQPAPGYGGKTAATTRRRPQTVPLPAKISAATIEEEIEPEGEPLTTRPVAVARQGAAAAPSEVSTPPSSGPATGRVYVKTAARTLPSAAPASSRVSVPATQSAASSAVEQADPFAPATLTPSATVDQAARSEGAVNAVENPATRATLSTETPSASTRRTVDRGRTSSPKTSAASLQERLAAIRAEAVESQQSNEPNQENAEVGGLDRSNAPIARTADARANDSAAKSRSTKEGNLEAPTDVEASDEADVDSGATDVSAPTGHEETQGNKRIGLRGNDYETTEATNRLTRSAKPARATSKASNRSAEKLPAKEVLASRKIPLLTVNVLGPDTVKVGAEAVYKIVLENAGEIAAKDVTISVQAPEWTTITSVEASAGAPPSPLASKQEMNWKLESVDANSTQTLTLRLIPQESRRFDLGVQCAFSPVSAHTAVEVQEPKLEITVAGPKEIFYGEKKVYKLHVSNPGTGDAENIQLQVSVGQGRDQSAIEVIPFLAAGETHSLEMELEARQSAPIHIRASAESGANLRAELNETVLVRRAALAAEIEGPEQIYARGKAVYNISVANTGNASAENAKLVVQLPAGASLHGATGGGELDRQRNQVVWKLGRLRPEVIERLTLDCALNEPGENKLRVVVAADGDLQQNGDFSTAVQGLADLRLELKDPPGAVQVGEDMTYEIVVYNRGTEAAENVDIAAYCAEGVTPVRVEGSPAQIFAADGAVEFERLKVLPPDASAKFLLTARAEQPGNHTFRVEVVCQALEIRLAADEITRFHGDSVVAETPEEAADPESETISR